MRTEKRKAEVGERVVLIFEAREGQIGTVTQVDDAGVSIQLDNYPLIHVTFHENYEVITGDDMVEPQIFKQDKMEGLLHDLIEAIEVNSKKMKQEYEDGHDYAYLRYAQGKDQAYREILELIDGGGDQL